MILSGLGTQKGDALKASTSERPKPLFWFRSNTETETQIGRYRNQYQNHISEGKSSYQ